LTSQIDPRFGRCAFFCIVETQDMTFQAFENENAALGGGAGIQSAQFVASKGAKAIITGNCGPNALRTLTAAGIEIFLGQRGTVKDSVEKLRNGELRPATEPNVQDHYGMQAEGRPSQWSKSGVPFNSMGMGTGGGMGMGRGMGRGLGRGMGCGRGMGRGSWTSQMDFERQGWDRMTKTQELELLKSHATDLKEEMEAVLARIEALENE
jgi:predicted Fe-Mo cluster-binding NifX family protein